MLCRMNSLLKSAGQWTKGRFFGQLVFAISVLVLMLVQKAAGRSTAFDPVFNTWDRVAGFDFGKTRAVNRDGSTHTANPFVLPVSKKQTNVTEDGGLLANASKTTNNFGFSPEIHTETFRAGDFSVSYVTLGRAIDRLPIPPQPAPRLELLGEIRSSTCFSGGDVSLPEAFAFCCGVRYAPLGATQEACWGPSKTAKDSQKCDEHDASAPETANRDTWLHRVLPPECCIYGAICSLVEVYNFDLSSIAKWMNIGAIPPLASRSELGCLLQAEGKKKGVEVGVYLGEFSANLLYNWAGATELLLVDVWDVQSSYEDTVNSAYETLDGSAIMRLALDRLAPFRDQIRVCRNLSSECSKAIEDESIDFVYIDARHDRTSVSEDITTWWPKLRPGGLLAGHDYVTQWDVWARSVQVRPIGPFLGIKSLGCNK
eukprot:GHVT01086718.1.p1 GENE.GHVT01086718.1~~GHVT01086718.1.p1  ORF type:complete len:428 (+),score=19.11 GHVT01086718.1:456-1739(+)